MHAVMKSYRAGSFEELNRDIACMLSEVFGRRALAEDECAEIIDSFVFQEKGKGGRYKSVEFHFRTQTVKLTSIISSLGNRGWFFIPESR